jgi:hypothetical protein
MSRVLGCRVLLSGFRYSILKPDIAVVTEMKDLAGDCRECRVLYRRSTCAQICKPQNDMPLNCQANGLA